MQLCTIGSFTYETYSFMPNEEISMHNNMLSFNLILRTYLHTTLNKIIISLGNNSTLILYDLLLLCTAIRSKS